MAILKSFLTGWVIRNKEGPAPHIAEKTNGITCSGVGPAQDVVHEPMKAGTTTRLHKDMNEDYTGDLNSSRFFKALLLTPIMFFNVFLTKIWGKGNFLQ